MESRELEVAAAMAQAGGNVAVDWGSKDMDMVRRGDEWMTETYPMHTSLGWGCSLYPLTERVRALLHPGRLWGRESSRGQTSFSHRLVTSERNKF